MDSVGLVVVGIAAAVLVVVGLVWLLRGGLGRLLERIFRRDGE